jgi:hypothetical protein
MRIILLILVMLSVKLSAQPNFEVQEFTGVVKSIQPGLRFALEYITLDVNGKAETFTFYPEYGKFISQQVKLGDIISVKVNVNLKMKKLRAELEAKQKAVNFLLHNDRVHEIKINNDWHNMPDIEPRNQKPQYKIFLRDKVEELFVMDGLTRGLVFKNGVMVYSPAYFYSDKYISDVKVGDEVSFTGFRMGPEEGFMYPYPHVSELYSFNNLLSKTGKAYSYLYKQNSVCIGLKFRLDNGKELSVSFPSDDAKRVKQYLRDKEKMEIYYDAYRVEGQLHPPELHALVVPGDTLFIEKFGFYGGADGKHEHKDVKLTGKISRINFTTKGNIQSVIVDSDYYVEIDAMMAQQLGLFFQRGKAISIEGKERIRKEGEIYQKDYRIVTPEKVIVDGKTFLLYNP